MSRNAASPVVNSGLSGGAIGRCVDKDVLVAEVELTCRSGYLKRERAESNELVTGSWKRRAVELTSEKEIFRRVER